MKALAVRREIEGIYRTWHACGLRKPERGMKAGRLCDVCIAMIDHHMQRLQEKASNP